MKIKVKLQNFSSYSTIEAISVRFPLTFFSGFHPLEKNLAQFHHQNRSIACKFIFFFLENHVFVCRILKSKYIEIEIKS